MTTRSETLRALPVTVHTASHARQSVADLQRFETLVDATDAAVASSMHARRVASAAPATRTEGETADTLGAVLAAVGAITNAPAVPPTTASKRELVSWTLSTIKTWHDATRATKTQIDPGIRDPGACMELVHRLNAQLGGAAFG